MVYTYIIMPHNSLFPHSHRRPNVCGYKAGFLPCPDGVLISNFFYKRNG
jgi:hypothetical protein